MDGPHWIGSIAFELRSRESKALEPFRRALKDDHRHILLRPLQSALDRVDLPAVLSRHRRIEIDLGVLGADDFEDRLARRIADGIARNLHVAAPAVPNSTVTSEGAKQLLAFLKSGALPWPAAGKALQSICLALAMQDWPSVERLAEQLKQLFARFPETASRFARQCPVQLVFPIAALIAGRSGRQFPDDTGVPQFLAEDKAARLSALLVRLACGMQMARADLRWLDILLSGPPAWDMLATHQQAQTTSVAIDTLMASTPHAVAPDRSSEEDSAGAEAEASASSLPLAAAGSILLHPFLAGFCRASGLLDAQGAFLSEDHRARAALLLNFAATGEHEVAEPELALAKLLCGMEIAAATPRCIEPSDVERNEVESMLQATITHWTALGNTSAEALRETFLKRPGRLQCEGKDWRLLVEQRGVDILLDRLPWTMSLVMTSFMVRPIRVEWR